MAIIQKQLVNIHEENMEEYFVEILTSRSIPDINDSLKPSQRRIIYSMNKDRRFSNLPFTKSAMIVGSALMIHAHGDASLYNTAVNLTRKFSNMQPLVEGHGSFGNVYDPRPAQMRYTQMRLNKFSEEVLLDNINDNCVDFVPSYDESELEPVVLPSKIPMILINGSFGIGGAYRSFIPPHNPKNVINYTIDYIKNPNKSEESLIKDNELYPSFPLGGILDNKDIIKKYTTGEGKLVLRAKIIKDENKSTLTIVQLPYMKTQDIIIENIQEAVKKEYIKDIKGIDNGSERGKIKLIIKCFKGTDLNVVESQLYKHTGLQSTLPLSFVLVDQGDFKKYNGIKHIISDWVEFRRTTIRRIKTNLISKLERRIHILEGLLKVLDPKVLTKLIKLIREGNSRDGIKLSIQDKFDLSVEQAEYIVEMKIYRLSNIGINDTKNELADKMREFDDQSEFMKDPSRIDKYIIDELQSISKSKNLRNDFEITTYDDNMNELDIESLIPDENYTIVATKGNYIKKFISEMKVQKRGGKGINIGKLKDNDIPLGIISANSKDNILFITDKGKIYNYKCYKLPNASSIKTLGNNISNLIKKEKLVSIFSFTDDQLNNDKNCLLVSTIGNNIKLVSMTELKSMNESGLILSKLKDNDEVTSVKLVDITESSNVIGITSEGMVIRTDISNIPVIKRTTQGSNLFNNKYITESNKLVSVSLETKNTTGLYIITKSGLSKRVKIDEFSKYPRRVKGVMGINLKDTDDKVVSMETYENVDDHNLIIISNQKAISIPLSDISEYKRPAKGLTLQKLEDDNYIIDSCLI
ncbi:DNA gyrase subunit A [Listeria phage LPJP1]|nr:DNA gyrase subunit A [Listeria phage LPJP1]